MIIIWLILLDQIAPSLPMSFALMNRFILLLAPILLVFTFGIATATAQTPSGTLGSTSADADAAPAPSDQSSVVIQTSDDPSISDRQDVEAAMLQTSSGTVLNTSTLSVSTNSARFPTLPKQDSQAENGNRQIYYIVGGVLVATGAVVGILLLGGGDEGPPAIPPPEGRPQ